MNNTTVKTPRNLRGMIKTETATIAEIRSARAAISSGGDLLRHSGPSAIRARAITCRKVIIADSFLLLLQELAPKNKVAEILARAVNYPRLTNPKPVGNYWSFRDHEGMISYCPSGREQQFTNNGLWVRKGRQEMKPGRFVRAFLNPAIKVTDAEIEQFVTNFKAHAMANQWVIGEEPIEDAYKGDATFTSCMQGEPVGEFYSAIGVRTCVTVRTKSGKLLGRALIWKSDRFFQNDAIGLVDRIYGSEEVICAIKSWAHANSYAHKKYQSNACWDYVLPSGKEINSKVLMWEQELPKVDFYPYMDTFCIYADGKFYGDSPDCAEKGDIILRNTDGSYEVFRQNQVQDVDGDWIDADDAVEIAGDYYYIEDERIFCCDNCGEYRLRDDGFRATTPRGIFYLCSDCCETMN